MQRHFQVREERERQRVSNGEFRYLGFLNEGKGRWGEEEGKI